MLLRAQEAKWWALAMALAVGGCMFKPQSDNDRAALSRTESYMEGLRDRQNYEMCLQKAVDPGSVAFLQCRLQSLQNVPSSKPRPAQ